MGEGGGVGGIICCHNVTKHNFAFQGGRLLSQCHKA